MRLKYSYIIVFICFFAAQDLSAQRIRHITTEDGLSQGFVKSVVQSKDGYIWASTLNGVNRYDGEQFKLYKHDPQDPFSIGNEFYSGLYRDIEGNLWAIARNSIQYYDAARDGFVIPDLLKKSPIYFDGWGYIDDRNKLWIFKTGATPTLYSYKIVWKVQKGVGEADLVPEDTISYDARLYGDLSCFFTSDTAVFVGTHKKKLLSFSHKDHHLTQVSISVGLILQGWTDKADGSMWLLTPEEVIHWGAMGVQHFPLKPGNGSGPFGLRVNINGKTLIMVNDQVYQWDGNQLTETNLIFQEGIMSVCGDHQNNLWIGTNARGLRHIQLNHNHFNTILEGFCIGKPLVNGPDGRLWTFKGKNSYDNTGLYYPIHPTGEIGVPACKKACRQMVIDKSGRFWFIFPDWRLGYTSNPAGPITYIDWDDSIGSPIKIACKDSSEIWAVTGRYKLIRYQIDNGNIAIIDLLTPDIYPDPTLKKDQYSDFLIDSKDRVWIGLFTGVLGLTWDEEKQHYQKKFWRGEINGKNLMQERGVITMAMDRGNNEVMWIGTPSGLVRWDIAQNTSVLLGESNGLVNDFVYSIVPDQYGKLWLGTNKGLLEYDPVKQVARRFGMRDGLPATEFNSGAAAQASNGIIYMNTVSGITYFNPAAFQDNISPSSMAITGLMVNNTPVDMEKVVNGVLELPYYNNTLTVEFALLSYVNSEVNQYEYRIEGTHTEWIRLGTKNNLSFLNLSPGTYKLAVRGIDCDGQVSEPIYMQFLITPPVWKTWWAYLIYALLLLGVVAGGVRVWFRYAKVEHELELKAQDEKNRAAFEQFRARLFANISHEFRTPLTIILGLSGQLKNVLKGEDRSKIDMVYQSGEELLDLNNRILELSKKQELGLPIQYGEGNLTLLIEQLIPYFHFWAREKSITFTTDLPAESIFARFDANAIKSILSNLLSNAIKYTPEQGAVHLKVFIECDEAIGIAVTDTGIGMTKEVVSKIFDRFYQADNRNPAGGMGIGLSYVNELVRQMEGHISVDSTQGKGSTFRVLLPYLRAQEVKKDAEFTVDALPAIDATEENAELPLVLVVEDTLTVQYFVQTCLKGKYRVITANNGILGLEAAVEQVPDVVITDVMMPEMDGRELCRAIKGHPLTSHIPVLMLTALAQDEHRIKGLQTGADAYISKPFLQEELLAVLQNVLTQRARFQQRFIQQLDDQPGSSVPTTNELAAVELQLSPVDQAFWDRLLSIIEDNYTDSGYAMEHLQKDIGVSKSQLHRKVVSLTGKSAGYYLRRRRLEAAHQLLRDRPDLSISEIAYSCGFNNPTYFSSVFSAEYGHAPSVYRRTE